MDASVDKVAGVDGEVTSVLSGGVVTLVYTGVLGKGVIVAIYEVRDDCVTILDMVAISERYS